MKSQSLLYIDYAKRRLSVLLAPNTEFSFFAPIICGMKEVWQVEIDVNKEVLIFNGSSWEHCDDENILFSILKWMNKHKNDNSELKQTG